MIEIIEKFNLKDAKPCNIPMEPKYLKLDYNDKLLADNKKYRQAVDSLLYLATVGRRDSSVAINILCRRNENPGEKDLDAIKRVIRYLKTITGF